MTTEAPAPAEELTREELEALRGHTPGPWTAFPKRKCQEWHVCIPLPDDPTGLGYTLFPDGISGDNAGADARLIARAPDLLTTALTALARAEAAEARLARVEALADTWDKQAKANRKAARKSPAVFGEVWENRDDQTRHGVLLVCTSQLRRTLTGDQS